MSESQKGLFLTFEGPEGSGKTTQAKRLSARLRSAGVDVVHTREPGGTQTGEAIREVLQHMNLNEPMFPETELLLFSASRAQLVRGVIQPALDKGQWVICDRFSDSTTVYQGYGRGMPMGKILDVNRFAMGGTVPDLTILLDVEVERGFQRLQTRNSEGRVGLDRMEREDLDFHRRIRNGYLELARERPERFVVVDGSQDAEAVEPLVWAAVTARVGGRLAEAT